MGPSEGQGAHLIERSTRVTAQLGAAPGDPAPKREEDRKRLSRRLVAVSAWVPFARSVSRMTWSNACGRA